MSFQFTAGRFKGWASDNTPLAGGRLYTYASGTTTHKAAYTDATLGAACAYVSDGVGGLYIALDSKGEAQLWLGSGAYTFKLTDSSGSTVWTVDHVRDEATALALDLMDTAPGKGAALVCYDGGTAQDVLDEAKPMANYTALRAYTGRATGVRITQAGLAGFFQRDDADTTSADNGGTIIVDASGRRWRRLFLGTVLVDWFGAKGDWNGTTGTDDTTAIRAAFAVIKEAGGGKVVFTAGKNYRTTGYVGTDTNNPADLIHFCRVAGFGATLTLNANSTSTDALCLEGNGNEVHGLTVNSTRTIDHNSSLTPQRTPYQHGIVVGGKGHTQSPRSLGSLSDFVSGVVIRYCKVTNFNLPIQPIRAANVDVSFNVVDQYSDTGIIPDDCTTNINIIGNRITRGGDDCIFARHFANSPWATAGNYVGGVRIEKNWCQYSFGKGAGGGGYSDVSISDNDILDVWAGGINWEVDSFMHRDANDNTRIHIQKNRIVRPGRYWGTGKLKTTNLGNNQDCGIHTFYNNSSLTGQASRIKIVDNIITNPYGNGIAIHCVVDADVERNKIVSGNYDHGAGLVVSQGSALVADQITNVALRHNTIDTDLTLSAGQNAFFNGTFSISACIGRVSVQRNEIMRGTTSWSNSAGTVTSWDIDQEFVTYTTSTSTANVIAFTMPDLCASFSKIKTLAVLSGGGNRAWYEKTAAHYRNGGGATLQAASTIVEQESDVTWNAAFAVSGNNALAQVTGPTGNVIWRTALELRALTN